MHVRVVEAGQDQAATEIDKAGVESGKLPDRSVVADREDVRALDRYGLRGGLGGILRPHLGVDKDQVRLLCRCVQPAGAEQSK